MLEADRSGELGEVPTSLNALLAARLDKMAEAKPLLQIGAVLGRQFTLADLQAVAACSDEDLRAMVDKSVGSGLLEQAEPGNDSILMFRHALMQDAAYASLLNSEKRRLHAVALGHLEQKDRSASGGGADLAGVPCRARRDLGQGGALSHRLPVAGDSQFGQSRGRRPLRPGGEGAGPLAGRRVRHAGHRCAAARLQSAAGAGRDRPAGHRHERGECAGA